MKYEKISGYSNTQFWRITGVKRATFQKMVEILQKGYAGIKWVEDTLIQDGTFSLPGRKALLKSDMKYEVILVDATESPIERPQKTKNGTFRTGR